MGHSMPDRIAIGQNSVATRGRKDGIGHKGIAEKSLAGMHGQPLAFAPKQDARDVSVTADGRSDEVGDDHGEQDVAPSQNVSPQDGLRPRYQSILGPIDTWTGRPY